MDNNEMEKIYSSLPLDQIPWNSESPPQALVDLCESGSVKPCKAIDLGCGAGNYAIYLARTGFDVTGVDISNSAITLAKANAARQGVDANFIVANVVEDKFVFKNNFDFAYDWGMLHHIYPEFRQNYIKNVHRLLNPKGQYLSVCFSEKDTQFGGTGKYRETPLGTRLYFSSESELRSLFNPYFDIKVLKTFKLVGKIMSHWAVYAFMEKR